MSKELTTTTANTLEAYSSNLNSKLQFAKLLLQTQMCPQSFKTPEQVLAAMLYGQEIGFSPLQSLQCINVIQGRPTIDTNGIKAKILQAGGTFKTIKWTEQECTLECGRGEWKEKFTFSIQDAERMGLLSKDNWKRMPKQMNYARCISTLGRNMYADVLRGFYSKEEMEDAVIAPLDVTPEQKPAPKPEPVIEPEAGEPVVYYIPNLTPARRLFLEDLGGQLVEDIFWYMPCKVSEVPDKYIVQNEEQFAKIRRMVAKAKNLQEAIEEKVGEESA